MPKVRFLPAITILLGSLLLPPTLFGRGAERSAVAASEGERAHLDPPKGESTTSVRKETPGQEQGGQRPKTATTQKGEEKPTYEGSAFCGDCHDAEFEAWRRSTHATTLHPPSPREAEGVAANIFCAGHEIRYVLGGKHARRYLVADAEQKRHYLLPCRYDVDTKTWTTLHLDDWQTRPFERDCAACHTTNFSFETLRYQETGIGCERCHGPANRHGDFESAGGMIVFSKVSAREEVLVCASCHLQGGKSKSQGTPFPSDLQAGADLFADYHFDWASLENAEQSPIDLHQKVTIKAIAVDGRTDALRCTSCHSFH
ncbi:MAG: hypothetical protein D6812_04800, partial [Deltaproteobacteria bacterium]